jgi:hypothetical protein
MYDVDMIDDDLEEHVEPESITNSSISSSRVIKKKKEFFVRTGY